MLLILLLRFAACIGGEHLGVPGILAAVAGGARCWPPLAEATGIAAALLVLRWLWLTLGMCGSLRRAHRRGQTTGHPSARLTLVTTLADTRGAVTLAAPQLARLRCPLLLVG